MNTIATPINRATSTTMDNRTIHDLFTNLRTQYIPACERRRRTESSQLKSRNVRKFKPLVWNKPSFTLGASKLENTAISSSDRLIVKRKAQVVEDDNISSSNCLDTIPSTPTSVFNSYGPSSYNKRQWSKKDVDGLVDFTDKWISGPELKRRRRS